MSATLSQAYLFCYNSIQFVLWVRIFVALISVPYPAFSHLNEVTEMVSFCQKFCFLETLHPIVGLVKGGWFTPFSQFVGRNAVLFGFIIPLNQSNKWMYILYSAWSLSEMVRYPFYALSTIKINFRPWIWLRYTAFIFLYPVGVFAEIAVLYTAFPYAETNDGYWIFLGYLRPVMYLYMGYAYCVAFPGLYKYLLKTRRKVLSPDDFKAKSKAKKSS